MFSYKSSGKAVESTVGLFGSAWSMAGEYLAMLITSPARLD